MKILTFLGVIMLGLALLGTHLCITFWLGLDLACIPAQEAVDKLEASLDRLAEEANEQSSYQPNTIMLPSGANEEGQEGFDNAPRSPEKRTRIASGRRRLESVTFTRSYAAPGWIVSYQIVGAVFIICGTTFLAIAALKHKARNL